MEQALGCVGLSSGIWLISVFLDSNTSVMACRIRLELLHIKLQITILLKISQLY